MFAMQRKQIKSIEGPKAPWLLIVICLVLLAISVNFFGKKSFVGTSIQTPVTAVLSADTREPRIYTVSYRAGVFSPTNLRIHAGDTVRFKNEGFFPIYIISDTQSGIQGLPGFNSVGDIPQNSYFAFTFAEKGIFGYHNEKNPDESGTIIVR